MKLVITINCDGAAFDPDPVFEIGRILNNVADFYQDYGHLEDRTLYDINGNQAGRAEIFTNGKGS